MGQHPGLCLACRHGRIIRSGRGSLFHLCERSRTDPRFSRYPVLPVLRCAGFEPGEDPTPPPGTGSSPDRA